MKILSGIDILYIPRFRQSVTRGGERFLLRVFHREELRGGQTSHLAGIFASKEAIMKALSLPIDSWLGIHVMYNKGGAPKAIILGHKREIKSSSLSISHDGKYAIAQFIAILT